jgi:TldD protein
MMQSDIADCIKGKNADYIEVRLEESEATRISYRGERLEDLSRTSSIGGNVRALVKGGWGFISFNEAGDLEHKVTLAIEQARLVGHETSRLGNVEPVVDTVPADIVKSPSGIPLSAKKELLDEYNDIVLRTPGIQTSSINYYDGKKKVIFASSEGALIEQQRVDIGLRITAIASKDGTVQQIGLSMGSLGDYGAIEHLHDEVKTSHGGLSGCSLHRKRREVSTPSSSTRYLPECLYTRHSDISPSRTSFMRTRDCGI